jgi:Protein of unknown function (DUF2924)
MSKRLRNEIGAVRSKASTLSPDRDEMAAFVAALPKLDLAGLTLCWRNHLGGTVPAHLPRWLLVRILAYRLQAAAYGDLERSILRRLNASRAGASETEPFTRREPATREGASLKPGALLVREWKGRLQHAMVLEEGFAWQGTTYGSLSQVAKAITGTNWNGHRFFGLRKSRDA